MVTCNLWKDAGLVNGAQGTIHKVVYHPDREPPDLPAMILVKIPQYTGPSCIEGEDKIVPIVPVTRQWFKGKESCQRKALPLVPSYAITIHKAQGASLDSVIVDLGNREFAVGLCYTALSRCKCLQNLYFDGIMPSKERFMSHFNYRMFLQRKKEDKRLDAMEQATIANDEDFDILTDTSEYEGDSESDME